MQIFILFYCICYILSYIIFFLIFLAQHNWAKIVLCFQVSHTNFLNLGGQQK